MRKNISKVIEAFKLRKPAKGDSKGTCSTDGNTIYSYAMPIARRDSDGSINVIARGTAPSVTTRSQVDACQMELPVYGVRNTGNDEGWFGQDPHDGPAFVRVGAKRFTWREARDLRDVSPNTRVVVRHPDSFEV